jgi:hypothetical protein
MARLVSSFNYFRPIGADVESLLHFDFENPGAIGGAGAADATGGLGSRLKTKGVGDD